MGRSSFRTLLLGAGPGILKVYSSYAIQLQVSSREFAAHFNHRCSEMFQRPPLRIRGPDKKGMFFVTYHDKAFGSWWKTQSLDTLRPYIDSFPQDYLRGRFDSEANVNLYAVYLCGAENHRNVMQFDRDLCARLGMRTGGVLVYGKKGDQTLIEGRPIVRTMDRLRFSVNSRDFLRVIGGLAVRKRDEDSQIRNKRAEMDPLDSSRERSCDCAIQGGRSHKEYPRSYQRSSMWTFLQSRFIFGCAKELRVGANSRRTTHEPNFEKSPTVRGSNLS